MPHKVYHGKTGVVYNVTKSAVGVIIYKKVGNRYIEKRVNLRIEHVNLSRSREEFLVRVKTNAEKKRKAKAEGSTVFLKRQPLGPRSARTVDAKVGVDRFLQIAYEPTICAGKLSSAFEIKIKSVLEHSISHRLVGSVFCGTTVVGTVLTNDCNA